ncbi:MAG: bifunctional 2-polyprenyl-6-hydroxyphenol methylase/3-demethylubiquinol 3-O-methyltransferase UbiG [Holosporales bacterium]
MNQTRNHTIDPQEVATFNKLAQTWWDPSGPMRPLHQMNPARLSFIRDEVCQHFQRDPRVERPLTGLSLLDVGCGAGLLSEPLCRMGASVRGLDAAADVLNVARNHAAQQDLPIEYMESSIEDHAASGQQYDVITALEIVEHVADVSLFLNSCMQLLKPGGFIVLSTLNRTPQSYAVAIVGAEMILKWLPRGTHDWKKFITPAELANHLRDCGLGPVNLRGMIYNLFNRRWHLSHRVDVNYLISAQKAAGAAPTPEG